MNYRNKKLELYFKSMSAYLPAIMILKDHYAGLLFIVADLKIISSLACTVASLYELWLLLPKARNSKLASITEDKSRKGIRRRLYAEKSAESFHRGFVVLGRFADVSRISAEVLNVLERLAFYRRSRYRQYLTW